MDKILFLLLVIIIFLIGWIITYKKKESNKDTFEVIPPAPATQLKRVDRVSGKRFKRIYPTMNKRNKERKERLFMLKYELSLKGIHWTPVGLYWMTRKLAEQNR